MLRISRVVVATLLIAFSYADAIQAQFEEVLAANSGSFGIPYDSDEISQFSLTASINKTKPTTSNFDSNGIARDVVVKFDIRLGSDSEAANTTQLLLNGDIQSFTAPVQPDSERTFEIIIDRDDLSSGSNTFTLLPFPAAGTLTWGISDISVSYIEAIDLTIGTQDNSLYGFNQNPTRFTGLRANFTATEPLAAHELSVVGFDIDQTDESEVFINGNSLGFLRTRPGQFNAGNTFVIAPSLLVAGENQIEFFQKFPSASQGFVSESQREWAVRSLLVTALSSADLSLNNFTIAEPVIIEDTPLAISLEILNAGQSPSEPTMLDYYLSTDETISDDQEAALPDLLVGSIELAAVAPEETLLLSESLTAASLIDAVNMLEQTTGTNEFYLGICIRKLEDNTETETEMEVQNNCSNGVEVKLEFNPATVVPPVMLLLGDED